jgi:hypothetical protein
MKKIYRNSSLVEVILTPSEQMYLRWENLKRIAPEKLEEIKHGIEKRWKEENQKTS